MRRARPDRLLALAAELVRLKVDVIVTASDVGDREAAQQATKTIPIVMAASSAIRCDRGLVASLARPGGNITGLVTCSWSSAGNALELLKGSRPGGLPRGRPLESDATQPISCSCRRPQAARADPQRR